MSSFENCLIQVEVPKTSPPQDGLEGWGSPVGGQAAIPTYPHIIADDNCFAYATPAEISVAMACAQEIWDQCNIEWDFKPLTTECYSDYTCPSVFGFNMQELEEICEKFGESDSVNVFFVNCLEAIITIGDEEFPLEPCAVAFKKGNCVFVNTSKHEDPANCGDMCLTLAHELGHLLGLEHTDVYCNLMNIAYNDCRGLDGTQCREASIYVANEFWKN